MKKIPLTQGRVAIVDDEDYGNLMRWKWHFGKDGYALRQAARESGRQRAVYMHRVVNGTPDGMQTDHINGDKLDNRRSNLRSCTHGENQRNQRRYRNNTSGLKGVSWHKANGKWRAYIRLNGVQKHLGHFNSQGEAHAAYLAAAAVYHGDFANGGAA